MPFPFAETVTVIRQIENAHGDLTNGDSHDEDGCVVWPTTSVATITGQQDILTLGMTVLFSFDADVLATDKVTVRGVTYRVNGEPAPYKSALTNTEAGIEVQLMTATG